MKKTVLFVLLFFILLNCYSQPIDSLTGMVNRHAALFMSSPNAVGFSIGIYKDGLMHTFNYGSKIKGQQKKASSATPYGIGSISKTFAGLLLAYAVTENKVKLEDDIRLYLDGSYPNLEYNKQPLKLVYLASHLSRLPFAISAKAEQPNFTKADFFQALHQVRIDSLLGSRFQYSNAGVQLLEFILEKVYNKPYEQLLLEKISGSLKMSTTAVQLGKSQQKQLPSAYNEKGEPDGATHEILGAAGGMKSSVDDLLRYLIFQMNESNAAIKLSHKEVWGFDQDENKRYSCSLNWQMETLADGTRTIFQQGNVSNYSSFIAFSPELRTGVVILSNSFTMDAVSTLGNTIMRKLSGKN